MPTPTPPPPRTRTNTRWALPSHLLPRRPQAATPAPPPAAAPSATPAAPKAEAAPAPTAKADAAAAPPAPKDEDHDALMAAAKAGDFHTVDELAKAKLALARAADPDGKTALIHAAQNGHVPCVVALLEVPVPRARGPLFVAPSCAARLRLCPAMHRGAVRMPPDGNAPRAHRPGHNPGGASDAVRARRVHRGLSRGPFPRISRLRPVGAHAFPPKLCLTLQKEAGQCSHTQNRGCNDLFFFQSVAAPGRSLRDQIFFFC